MNGCMYNKDELQDMVEALNNNLSRIFYNVKNGLRNLWKWRSVVWNDRPWDYVYIFKALRFKLDETQRCIDGTFVGSEEEAAKIRSLIEAIDRILEDDYVSEEYKEILEFVAVLANGGSVKDMIKLAKSKMDASK